MAFEAMMGLYESSPQTADDGDLRSVLVDSSGRPIVNVAQIASVAPQMDDTDKLAVSNYGKNAAAGDIALNANSSGDQEIDLVKIKGVSAPQLDDTDKIAVSLYGKDSAAGDTPLNANPSGDLELDIVRVKGIALSTTDGAASGVVASSGYGFNGTTWDRQRGNVEGTALPSAARTALANSSDIVNYNGKYLAIFLDITVDDATADLTLSVEWKDPVTGDYEPIWTAAAAASAVGEFIYQLGPGLLAGTPGDYDDAENVVIPRTFRIHVAVGDADSCTYSVGYSLNV